MIILNNNIIIILYLIIMEEKNNDIILKNGNWEDCIKNCPDKSVDLIFCDLPYASKTFGKCIDCDWDTPINLEEMWVHFKRVRKDDHTPIFMCCNMKFAVDLITTNRKEFRYDLIWVKSAPCGHLSARKMPMRKHETLLVFYKKLPFYDLSSHSHKFIKRKKDSILDNCSTEQINKFKKNAISCNIKENPKENKLIDKDRVDVDVELNIELPENYNEGKVVKDCYNFTARLKSGKLKAMRIEWTPRLPTSIIEDNEPDLTKGCYQPHTSTKTMYSRKGLVSKGYDPPIPNSVIEPPLPISVVEEETGGATGITKHFTPNKNGNIYDCPDNQEFSGRNGQPRYAPPLPVSVVDTVNNPPDSLLRINSKKGKHPTQKPTELMKWVLKYYSKEGDRVLDIAMGSGSTGVACVQMARRFEGYEIDKDIYNVAQQRILIDKK
tara:strand:+ start:4068 stop:5378 length:1311 start_codon:yes stop_codon:yes gene_type:complete